MFKRRTTAALQEYLGYHIIAVRKFPCNQGRLACCRCLAQPMLHNRWGTTEVGKGEGMCIGEDDYQIFGAHHKAKMADGAPS